jgi:hypothetical protein
VSLATIQHAIAALLLNHVLPMLLRNNGSRQEWVAEICQEFLALPISGQM